MTINTKKLANILQSFVSSINDVEAAALLSPDGLPIATQLPSDIDEEHISGMSAALLSLSERISVELSTGTLEVFCVEGSNGYAILTSCGEDAVLFVLASKSAKQGRLMLEIKRVVAEIKPILRIAEDLVEDLKDFFAEDLVEDLEDFLSEDFLLQADLKDAVARLVNQEVVVEQSLVTSRNPDHIPACNHKMIEEVASSGHEEQSGKGGTDLSIPLANSVGFTVDGVKTRQVF